jgi:hypothetical protein
VRRRNREFGSWKVRGKSLESRVGEGRRERG